MSLPEVVEKDFGEMILSYTPMLFMIALALTRDWEWAIALVRTTASEVFQAGENSGHLKSRLLTRLRRNFLAAGQQMA